MGRPLQEIDWTESAEALYEGYRAARDLNRRKRWHVLWLVHQGRTATAAATEAGVGRRTVLRWLDWYRAGGREEVLRRVPGHGARGATCWLSAEQQTALLDRCRAGAFRTYGEAQRWVNREFGVGYRYDGIHTLLTRLGVHPKVPRPTAAKADPAVQEAWKKGTSGTRS
jgi:transposase